MEKNIPELSKKLSSCSDKFESMRILYEEIMKFNFEDVESMY